MMLLDACLFLQNTSLHVLTGNKSWCTSCKIFHKMLKVRSRLGFFVHQMDLKIRGVKVTSHRGTKRPKQQLPKFSVCDIS
jgi:hypothetical protein